jgi:uncharacterized protein YndB with AHSA1/START domain
MDAREGAILKTGQGWEIRFERRLGHAPQKVWNAIVGPGQMSRWFDRTEFPAKLEVGATIRFFHDAFGMESQGRITRLEPPRLIEWMWTAAFAPDQLMSWEIVSEPDGCRLILRQQIADESLLGRTTAGWHVCLDRMQAALDDEASPSHMSSWPALFEHYKAVLKGLGLQVEQQGAPPAKT